MSQNRDRNLLLVSPSTHIQGIVNASTVLVMYGDYQCSRSGDVYRLIKAIQRQLVASLRENYLCLIFRHFPQVQLYPQAQRAAEAAEAAATQGQFWQMHDILFDRQYALEDASLVEYANVIGLDISQFLRDMSRQTSHVRINKDIESGLQSGVTRTPTLFMNGIRYTDAWKMEALLAAITKAVNLL